MDLVATLVATVQAAPGGEMLWEDFVETVPYQDRQKITPALRLAKQQGLLKRSLVWNPETSSNVHTVKYVGGS